VIKRSRRCPRRAAHAVAKAFSTDIGIEVASIGVQVHGGMGFIEETGAAQHLRDARIAAIYEGTNGIQALDLAMRKVPLDDGAVVRTYIGELRDTVRAVQTANDPAFGATGARLAEAVDSLNARRRGSLARSAPSQNQRRRRHTLSSFVRQRRRRLHAGRRGARGAAGRRWRACFTRRHRALFAENIACKLQVWSGP